MNDAERCIFLPQEKISTMKFEYKNFLVPAFAALLAVMASSCRSNSTVSQTAQTEAPAAPAVPVTQKNGVAIPDRPILLQGGPGIAISGSATEQQLPPKARQILSDFYKDDPLSKCHINFLSGQTNVQLADGTKIQFDKDGGVMDISQGQSRSIDPALLKEILKPEIYNHLDKINRLDRVCMVKNAEGTGTCIMMINTTPSQLIFDSKGLFVITAG